MRYKIVRFRFSGDSETVKYVDTLEEAQEHCNDPNNKNDTGPMDEAWFDGYFEEDE